MTVKGGFRRYEEVSFLKGYAMFTVVLMHLIQVFADQELVSPFLWGASSLGGTGGHVFVICSGFGLMLSQMRRPLHFGEFLKRRFVKIYIPYIIIVLISYFSPYFWYLNEYRFQALLSHVFLYKMFSEKYICSFGLQFWFISTIFQLYLLFLPLYRLREKTSLRTLLLTGFTASAAWWIAMELTGLGTMRIWGSFCLQYLWEFCLGMALAEILSRREELHIPTWLLLTAMLLGLGLQFLFAIKKGWLAAFNDVPGTAGYTAMALLLYQYGKHVIRPGFLRIAPFSYEWFLTHVLSFSAGYQLLRGRIGNELILGATVLLLSLGIGWVYAKLMTVLLKKLL